MVAGLSALVAGCGGGSHTSQDIGACLEDAGARRATTAADLRFAVPDAQSLSLLPETTAKVGQRDVYEAKPKRGDYRVFFVSVPDASEAISISESVSRPTGAKNLEAVYYLRPAASDDVEQAEACLG
jgi:hypothetical protein